MNFGFRSLTSMFSLLLLAAAMIHCVPERFALHQHRDGTEHHHPDADNQHEHQNSSSEDQHADSCQESCLRAVTAPGTFVSFHEVIVVNAMLPGFFYLPTESLLALSPGLWGPPDKIPRSLSVCLSTLIAAPNAPPMLAI